MNQKYQYYDKYIKHNFDLNRKIDIFDSYYILSITSK